MAVFIINNPRAVFIHIPKTGGASIRHGFFDGDVKGPFHGFVPEQWNDCFKFAFVRNPYDRVISAWKMFESGMDHSVWQQPIDEAGIGLRSFLEIVMDESVAYNARRKTTHQKIRHHAIPQTHPFHCLETANFVGRFETLQDDFDVVCHRLSIAESVLPHWNRTNHAADVMRYFDAETLSMVNDYYADDFVELGYSRVSNMQAI